MSKNDKEDIFEKIFNVFEEAIGGVFESVGEMVEDFSEVINEESFSDGLGKTPSTSNIEKELRDLQEKLRKKKQAPEKKTLLFKKSHGIFTVKALTSTTVGVSMGSHVIGTVSISSDDDTKTPVFKTASSREEIPLMFQLNPDEWLALQWLLKESYKWLRLKNSLN